MGCEEHHHRELVCSDAEESCERVGLSCLRAHEAKEVVRGIPTVIARGVVFTVLQDRRNALEVVRRERVTVTATSNTHHEHIHARERVELVKQRKVFGEKLLVERCRQKDGIQLVASARFLVRGVGEGVFQRLKGVVHRRETAVS